MKDLSKTAAMIIFGLVVVSIPVLFYGAIAFVLAHFIRKLW
jgi:hypothetical protein